MPQKLQARFKPRARAVAWMIILFCTTALMIRYPVAFAQNHRGLPTDFQVYLRAWERIRAGEIPYQAADSSPYKYSPGVLALVSLLPPAAGDAWISFSSVCILGFAFVLLIGARYQTWRSVALLTMGLGLAWKGILETLDYGQLELLILIMAVAAAALQKRQPLIAGFLAGVLPWIKLPWVMFLFPLILIPVESLSGPGRKERRVRLLISGYVFSCFFWGAAVPSLIFGPERAKQLSQAWMSLLRTQPPSLYFSDINQSAWVSALRWVQGLGHGTGLVAVEVAAGLVAIVGGLFLGRFTVRSLSVTGMREIFPWISPWLVLIQLLNPLSWRWGSVFLVGVPFAIQTAGGSGRRRELRYALAALAFLFWLLQLNPVAHLLGFHHWSELHGFGLVTGYWMVLLILSL